MRHGARALAVTCIHKKMRATKRQHALILFTDILREGLEHLGDQGAQVSGAAAVTHSLSYQETILASLPLFPSTCVKSAAKIEL